MPLVSSTYRPPFLFRSAHYATVWCGLFREVEVPQVRERITLEDGDFLDLDWSYSRQYAVGSRQDAVGSRQDGVGDIESNFPEFHNKNLATADRRPPTQETVGSRQYAVGDLDSDLSDFPNKELPTADRRLPTQDTVGSRQYAVGTKQSNSVAILLHGLEGHGQRPYMTGNARWLTRNGIDACAVNFRGCSGEPNALYHSYHSGATEDLDAVVQHVVEKGYQQIYLVGISLGGNMLLKYLGEEREVPEPVRAGVAICAPCDLYASLQCIMSFENTLYARRFKNHLVAKLRKKQDRFPEKLSDDVINRIGNLKDFDDVYTSKAHGFKDAMDYYTQCSSKQFLPALKRPVLILNAKDDTFLKGGCYPIAEAERYGNVYLEMPKWGGHVGFVGPDNVSYAEARVLEFIREVS